MKKRRLVYFVLVIYYVGRCGGFGRRRGAMTKIYYMNFFPIKKKENEMRKNPRSTTQVFQGNLVLGLLFFIYGHCRTNPENLSALPTRNQE